MPETPSEPPKAADTIPSTLPDAPDTIPSILANLSEKELEGLRQRAEREGVEIGDLKLRKSDVPENQLTEEEEADRAVPAILARAKGKPVSEVIRETDNPELIMDAMARFIQKAGWPVKDRDTEENGPVTGRMSEEEMETLRREHEERTDEKK